MAAVTSLGSSFTITAGAKTVTATPAVGDLIVIVCANSGRTATQYPTVTDNNSSGIYTRVCTVTKNSSADSMWVYVRTTAIPAASSTIFTFTPLATDTGGGLHVMKVVGCSLFGADVVRQWGLQNNVASGTPAPVLPSSPDTYNVLMSAVFNGTNPGGITGPTSWTRHVDLGYTANGLDSASINGTVSSATATWGSSSASAFGSFVLELACDRATYNPVLRGPY